MTTRNLDKDEIKDLTEAVAASIQGVRDRAMQVMAKDDELKSKIDEEKSLALQEVADANALARLFLQVRQDNIVELEEDRKVLDEERGQLESILGAAPVAAPVAEASEVTPVVPVEPTPPAESSQDPNAEELPVAPTTEGNRQPISLPNWGWLAWLLAAIGVVLGLVIADGWNADELVRAQTSSLVGGLFTILWWLGWPCLLGGLLGYYGARIEERPAA